MDNREGAKRFLIGMPSADNGEQGSCSKSEVTLAVLRESVLPPNYTPSRHCLQSPKPTSTTDHLS